MDVHKMKWHSEGLSTLNSIKKFREHAEFMFKGLLGSKTEEAHWNYLMIWTGENTMNFVQHGHLQARRKENSSQSRADLKSTVNLRET